MIAAVIPARGGSERFPGKNLAMLGGVTLLARTVRQAREADLVDEVYVSTDSPQIEDAAFGAGAVPITRPAGLSGPKAPSEWALIHALDALEDVPDVLVMLQCTSPLRAWNDIDNAIRMLIEDNLRSVFSVYELRARLWKSHCLYPVEHHPGDRQRTQDMDPFLVENGSIYVMRTEALLDSKDRMSGRMRPYVMAPGVDIDTEDDLRRAECLLPLSE